MPKAMIVPARPPAEGSPFHTRFPIVGLLALAVGSARSKCVLLISVRSRHYVSGRKPHATRQIREAVGELFEAVS